jgi:hypothetical protein
MVITGLQADGAQVTQENGCMIGIAAH